MPERKVISTAKTPDQLQKAYLDAVSGLRHSAFTMPVKKYDEHQVTGWMAGNKKAEFCLLRDKSFVTMTVEVGSNKEPLAQCDIAKGKQEDMIRLVAGLQHSGLMDQHTAEGMLEQYGLRKVERHAEDQPPDTVRGVVKKEPMVIGGHRAPPTGKPVIGGHRGK